MSMGAFAIETARCVIVRSGWRGLVAIAWHNLVIQRMQYDSFVTREAERDMPTVTAGESRRISLVMPIYNPSLDLLQAAIGSVRSQGYTDWELCLADDCSPDPAVRPFLEQLTRDDSRIRCVYRGRNGHISAASNSALEMATGEFVVLLDQDDLLSATALARVASMIQQQPDLDLIYSDEDKLDQQGQRFGPYFKPDWNWGQMVSHNMFSHLGVYRTALLREIGGFTPGLEGSQDYDLVLRASERTMPERIGHCPDILYHWRVSATSTAMNPNAKRYAFDAGARAIQRHLDRTGRHGQVRHSDWLGLYAIDWTLPQALPSVGIIEWNGGRVVRAQPLSFGDPWPARASSSASRERLSVQNFQNTGLASALDEAIRSLAVEYVVLIHSSCRSTASAWWQTLVATAVQTQADIVGGKLVTPNGRVRHASYVIGTDGRVLEIGRHMPMGIPGPYRWLESLRECAAVSGAAALVRRDLVDETGGLAGLCAMYGWWDVGLGLEAMRRKRPVLWTPHVQMTTTAAEDRLLVTLDEPAESAFRERRLAALDGRRFYSIHHDESGRDFEILVSAGPARLHHPPHAAEA